MFMVPNRREHIGEISLTMQKEFENMMMTVSEKGDINVTHRLLKVGGT